MRFRVQHTFAVAMVACAGSVLDDFDVVAGLLAGLMLNHVSAVGYIYI